MYLQIAAPLFKNLSIRVPYTHNIIVKYLIAF